MSRILALDMGSKTIGVAISDELMITGQALTTLMRSSRTSDLAKIKALVVEHTVQELVMGLPKNMDGSIGPQGEKAMHEAEWLKKELGLPVHLWDERLSTVQAERILLEADLSRRKRKKLIDKLAAQIILQSYLDYRKLQGEGKSP